MAKKQSNKRKRGSPEPEQHEQEALPSHSPPGLSQLSDSPSSSEDSEQSEQEMLDSFQESTAAQVEAFNNATADATAFLQPSAQISDLARQAAKVC